MAEILCGVCATEPKNCSLPCFKTHKPTHSDPSNPPPTTTSPTLPQPAQPPTPKPRYLKQRRDFSLLATNPKFQSLLKTNQALLPALQRVYAKTIRPDPEDERRRRMLERNAFRGRGTRGRGRGRGGGRGGWNAHDEREERWTPKKGDKDAMGVLKEMRGAQASGEEKDAMELFVGLVEELFVQGEKSEKGEGEGV
ncbi:hypothetical protein L13192_08882 [Pyrenophora tritici-repentis]|uniref:HIT-type domain-containing protein n=1 Tax=Pyrenophora tritici-repentis TaxID=45151 RepID=A0A922SVQ0_9PLEO|nr:hypothetical protein Ptr86124_006694 [Pyrenophora tritici-repentis]KAI1666638.1 hypothetical protein L13192_08882 [Pyrenophora tritici-repentis]KAI1682465.1 hypothetical protein KJE20_07197 [Pyrenophora tritici-repentis]